MKKTLLLLSLCSTLVFAETKPSPEQALKNADAVNELNDNMQFDVAVRTNKRNYDFEVFINQRTNSIVKYIKPIKDKGKMILAKGFNMWIFIPSGKKPIRISPQQRLIGGVSNIDVARVSLGIDYKATSIDAGNYNGKPVWKLQLASNNSKSMYEKVELFIDKKTSAPQKAIFFTKSGKAIKSMTFAGYKKIQEKSIATKRTIIDLLTNTRAELTYSNFKQSDISDELFQPNAFAFF